MNKESNHMNTEFLSPQGKFHLNRLPLRKNETLKAWDAADEYLLNYLSTETIVNNSTITLLNDSFGALAVALHNFQPFAISDSYLSQLATRHNFLTNNLCVDSAQLYDSLNLPIINKIDYLLIKPPKTLALLEDQLYRIRPYLTNQSKIIVGGMIKNMPLSIWQILERILGKTTTYIAIKKARLIFVTLDTNIKALESPYPTCYRLTQGEFEIWNHANVFSREKLDIGSRFLLQHLPDNSEYREIIDLGCGNGVIGLVLASQMPEINLHFVDESYMAIASAKLNFEGAFGLTRQATFTLDDCLSNFPENSVDCIICNPPFHQQHTIVDQIAWQKFQQAAKVLRKNGELRIIGNRHLNYHHHLKKIFGNYQHVASNDKFVILKCFKK